MPSTTSRWPARCGARDRLFDTLGGRFGHIAILGGWYGVLAAMLLEDERFDIGIVESFDIDPSVAPIARTLNEAAGGRFRASTGDMYNLDYGALGADLIVNTSCEHIADLRGWLARCFPRARRCCCGSNDYFSEPTHINCVESVEAFSEATRRAGAAGFFRVAADEEIHPLHADRLGVSPGITIAGAISPPTSSHRRGQPV